MYMTWIEPPGKEFTPRDCWLLEYYCDPPDCDCPIVVLEACSCEEPKLLATIMFGWESFEFYQDTCAADDDTLHALRQGTLDPSGPTDEMARIVLEVVQKEFLSNPKVVARFKRHHEMHLREMRKRSRLSAKDAGSARVGGVTDSKRNRRPLLRLWPGRLGKPRRRFDGI